MMMVVRRSTVKAGGTVEIDNQQTADVCKAQVLG
jgi:hypothetical protein